jgi:hypothetical protein
LAFDEEPGFRQLMSEADLVYTLEHPRPQRRMDPERCVDDYLRYPVL